MTMIRIFICSLAFIPGTWASAQEPSVPGGRHPSPWIHGAGIDAADSAAFGQFMRGMQPGDPGGPEEGQASRYRLEWIVSEHGGLTVVARGDSSAPALLDTNTLIGPMEFALSFRTAEGKRGRMVVSDIPCGLICRTTWYYVEE
jgi:hypothetical protein